MTRRARIQDPDGIDLVFASFGETSPVETTFRPRSRMSVARPLLLGLAGLVVIAVAVLALGIWASRRLAVREERARAVRDATAQVTAFTKACVDYAAAPAELSPPDPGPLAARLDTLYRQHPELDTLRALRHWTVVQAHVHHGLVALERKQYEAAEYQHRAELRAVAQAGRTYQRVFETLAMLGRLEAFQAEHPEPVHLATDPPQPFELRVAHAGGQRLAEVLSQDSESLSILVPRLHARAGRAVGEILPQVELWLASLAERDVP